MAAGLVLEQEADQLAKQLFGSDNKKAVGFTNQLLDTCKKAQGKDFLLIHNPGGWGTTRLENLLQWERSIVEGVSNTIERLGYSHLLIQYFRTNSGWREIIGDIKEQTRFFTTKAKIMAAELKFITQHLDNLRVVIIGVSQGAAFSNAVLQHLNGTERVFSIELGTPFPYKSRRVITKQTLALDSNGLMPDALMEWDVPTILKTYLSAPFRWLKYKLQRKRIKFTYCINLPGHDYNWDYPEVQRQVEKFLNINFSNKHKKHNVEEEVS
jgi:pimeloyl-ACP methyl ester carboxylesterase